MTSKIMIVLGAVCIFIAMIVRFTPFAYWLPARMLPVNWIKLGDTLFLLSIALSLVRQHSKK